MEKLSDSGSFKDRLKQNQLCLCMAIAHSRTSDLPLIVQAAGFDSFYIDMEHYPFSIETAASLCTSALGAGLPSFVRVPSHDPQFIGRILDGGATGVIVPHVENAEQAQAAVKAARFPPLGNRGVPGPNPVTRFKPYSVATAIEHMDPGVVVVVMLESAVSVENAEQIAAVDGIDVVMIGSNDLALDLGIPGELNHPKILEAYEKVAAACGKSGKSLGIAGIRADRDLLTRLVQMGGRFVIAGSDTGYLLAAASASAEECRSIPLSQTPFSAVR